MICVGDKLLGTGASLYLYREGDALVRLMIFLYLSGLEDLEIKLSQKEIASTISISERRVNTMLNKLVKDGLLEKNGYSSYKLNPEEGVWYGKVYSS